VWELEKGGRERQIAVTGALFEDDPRIAELAVLTGEVISFAFEAQVDVLAWALDRIVSAGRGAPAAVGFRVRAPPSVRAEPSGTRERLDGEVRRVPRTPTDWSRDTSGSADSFDFYHRTGGVNVVGGVVAHDGCPRQKSLIFAQEPRPKIRRAPSRVTSRSASKRPASQVSTSIVHLRGLSQRIESAPWIRR
jgi:hypothetical protein